MKIDLNLHRHCIETETKRLYNQALSTYFHPDSDKDTLEKTINILERALKNLDFRKLRSRYPELSGGYAGAVAYDHDEREQYVVLLNQESVERF